MSQLVTVPKHVHDRIKAHAEFEFDGSRTAINDENGTVTFPLSDETVDRLQATFPGLSLPDAIERLLSPQQ